MSSRPPRLSSCHGAVAAFFVAAITIAAITVAQSASGSPRVDCYAAGDAMRAAQWDTAAALLTARIGDSACAEALLDLRYSLAFVREQQAATDPPRACEAEALYREVSRSAPPGPMADDADRGARAMAGLCASRVADAAVDAEADAGVDAEVDAEVDAADRGMGPDAEVDAPGISPEWKWVALGVAVAGAAAGATFTTLARDDADAVEAIRARAAEDDSRSYRSEALARLADFDRNRVLARLGFGVAAAGLVATLALWHWQSDGITVTPLAGGLGVFGRF